MCPDNDDDSSPSPGRRRRGRERAARDAAPRAPRTQLLAPRARHRLRRATRRARARHLRGHPALHRATARRAARRCASIRARAATPAASSSGCDEGTHIPHILEHVALELQNLAGSDVGFGRVVPSGDAGVWWVIVAYEEEDVGLESMRDAVAHRARLHRRRGRSTSTAIVDDLQDLHESVRLGPSTGGDRRGGAAARHSGAPAQLALARAARARQATCAASRRRSPIARAPSPSRSRRTRTRPSACSSNIGLPVPQRRRRAHASRTRSSSREEIGFPVILKPLDASHGRGISRAPRRRATRCAQAWRRSRSSSAARVVVEQFAAGRDHRVLVVNGKVVACAERVPAHVIGDGTQHGARS